MVYDQHAADVERENALMRAILARLFEVGPAERTWATIYDDGLSLNEQEHGEGIAFDLTADEVALLRQIEAQADR